MWGKGQNVQNINSQVRITPTHVGKSLEAEGEDYGDKDHPHPCGEKYIILLRL